MKTLRLCGVGLISLSVCIGTLEAQVSSARKLTQRIAPLLPPAPPNAGRGVATQPGVRFVAPVPNPTSSPASGAKVEDELGGAPAKAAPEPPPAERSPVPLIIECNTVKPDSRELLQFVSLSLTNTSAKPINRVTMRLLYFAGTGEKLKEWTTRRDLEPPMAGNSAMELTQPAYFMPLVTKRVKVEVVSVRFADSTEWTAD